MTEIQNQVVNEEEKHLCAVQDVIREQLDDVEKKMGAKKGEILNQKKYLWENLYELDPEEIVSNRISILEEHSDYEYYETQKRLLLKLQDNTFFGRIDFVCDGDDEAQADDIYIGIAGLRSKNGVESIVFDWRAPIASMYYDYELGEAHYEAPIGTVSGRIIRKRQMKVRHGKLQVAIESNFKVDDETLQRELAGNCGAKMRNIVATIQKEQNCIVRNQTSDILLIQGVAGSGKTSVALHRIAFMLYQNKGKLNSNEILIISPNRIFADYISNVLPELGEENIVEVSFDEIAEHELEGIKKFESKYHQMEYIIACDDENDRRLQRIRFKNSTIFLEKIKEYVSCLESNLVQMSDYRFHDSIFSRESLDGMYNDIFSGFPVFERLEKIGDRLADIYESEKGCVVSVRSRNDIKQDLKNMAMESDIVKIYRGFIEQLSDSYPILKDDTVADGMLLYEDVFPIVLIKFLLNGYRQLRFDRIKHVVVDEMQEYSIIEYEILRLLFKCNMTILGDINQTVDQNSNLILEKIQDSFSKKITVINMMKSYRSTYEINEFCKKMCNLKQIESIERHGKVPVFEKCRNYDDMIEKIQERMDSVDMGKVATMAIICKSAAEADKLYGCLEQTYKIKCCLLNHPNSKFCEGIIVTNSYLAKGLEFDYVIVPSVTQRNYKTGRDRQVLYIACTRALHQLDLLYYEKKSKFLEDV